MKTETLLVASKGSAVAAEKTATQKKKEEEDEKAEISSIRFKGTSEVNFLFHSFLEMEFLNAFLVEMSLGINLEWSLLRLQFLYRLEFSCFADF